MKNVKEILNELLEGAIYADKATDNLSDEPVSKRVYREFELRAEYDFYMIAHELLKNINKENIEEAEEFIKELDTRYIFGPEFKVKIAIEKRIEELIIRDLK